MQNEMPAMKFATGRLHLKKLLRFSKIRAQRNKAQSICLILNAQRNKAQLICLFLNAQRNKAQRFQKSMKAQRNFRNCASCGSCALGCALPTSGTARYSTY